MRKSLAFLFLQEVRAGLFVRTTVFLI